MSDVGTCLKRGAAALAAAGIENPWREARLLLAHVAGLTVAALIGYPERPIASEDEFDDLVARRAAHEPMSHLLGRREFWSLEFEVTADTLDPRPDSETVVEAVLKAVRKGVGSLRILDLGTGTGCLLAALLSEFRRARGVGVERSAAAAMVAQRNLERLGLADRGQIVVADWTVPLRGAFDVIVSNPPYIPAAEIAALQPEVAEFEPGLALNGGIDGLDAYRRLFPAIVQHLTEDGIAAVEFGDGQRDAVVSLAELAGLEIYGVRADLAGRPRCLVCGRARASSHRSIAGNIG